MMEEERQSLTLACTSIYRREQRSSPALRLGIGNDITNDQGSGGFNSFER